MRVKLQYSLFLLILKIPSGHEHIGKFILIPEHLSHWSGEFEQAEQIGEHAKH